MSVALVQGWTSASNSGSAITTLSVTLGSPSTSGHFIVVCFRNPFTSAGLAVGDITVTDDQSNTYVNAAYENGGATFPAHQVSNGIWYCKSITGSATPQITVTTANAGFWAMDVAEFSGGGTPDPLDGGSNTNVGTGTAPATGWLANVWVGNGLVVSIQTNNQTNTVTDGSGWTRIVNDSTGTSTSDYQIGPGNVFYSASWTLSVNAGWEATIAAFKPSGAVDTQEWRGCYPPEQRRGAGPSIMYHPVT